MMRLLIPVEEITNNLATNKSAPPLSMNTFMLDLTISSVKTSVQTLIYSTSFMIVKWQGAERKQWIKQKSWKSTFSSQRCWFCDNPCIVRNRLGNLRFFLLLYKLRTWLICTGLWSQMTSATNRAKSRSHCVRSGSVSHVFMLWCSCRSECILVILQQVTSWAWSHPDWRTFKRHTTKCQTDWTL